MISSNVFLMVQLLSLSLSELPCFIPDEPCDLHHPSRNIFVARGCGLRRWPAIPLQQCILWVLQPRSSAPGFTLKHSQCKNPFNLNQKRAVNKVSLLNRCLSSTTDERTPPQVSVACTPAPCAMCFARFSVHGGSSFNASVSSLLELSNNIGQHCVPSVLKNVLRP